MANTALMREVADYLDKHPKRYGYGWRGCIAGTAVRLGGGRFIGRFGDYGSYREDMLRPTSDDPTDDVEVAPYRSWNTDGGVRYVRVEVRAERLFELDGISDVYRLFFDMPGVVDRSDAHEVVEFLRREADRYDSMGST